jgi:hypothetical protein
MATTASIIANLNALLTGAAGGLGVASIRHPLEKSWNFADGTGLNKISKVWSRKAQSLVLSGTESWDLAGALTDAQGNAVVFTKVRALYLYAYLANVNNVVIGNDTNHLPIFGAVTHTQAVFPNGAFLLVNPTAAGWAVAAGTGDIIKITNSGAGTAVVYDLAVLGE